MKKLKRKTRWVGLLLSLCMVLSIVPLTAVAEETESTEEVESTERDSLVEHILNEENNWDISDELIMPGESFCIEPKYECTTSKVQSGVLEFAAVPILSHVSLLLSHPDSDPNSDSDDGKARWYTNKLVRSTADTTKIVPCKTNTYNVIKTAYDKGDLDSALAQNPQDAEHQAALQAALQSALSGETTVNAGYVNNTGLPFVLEQVRGGSTQFEGTVKGGKYGETILVDASSTHNWGCTIRFYEPYYTLSYTGLQEGEEEGLPDRYYIQNEKQELVMAGLIRPGKHLVQWKGLPFAEQRKVGDNVVLSFDWDNICHAGYNFGDETLSPVFEDGFTVTFNPNGGTIDDKETDIHELDTTSETFFDIGAYVPKRDGYTFLGWCSYPSADDDSLIKNTKNYDWVDKWVADWNNSLVEKKYDIQLYAKWEKTDTPAEPDEPVTPSQPTQDTVDKIQSTGETKAIIEFADGVNKDFTLDIQKVEVKKELADKNVKFIADINVMDGDTVVKLSDTKMKIRIALPEELKGYNKYEVVYILNDEIKETIPATVEDDYIVFETSHLSQYGIIAANTGSSTGDNGNETTDSQTGNNDKIMQNTDATSPKTGDNGNETTNLQTGNNGKITQNTDAASPKTGDSSNLALWFAVLCISSGGVIAYTVYSKRRKLN